MYQVLHPILHNGELHTPPCDPIQLDRKDAAELVSAGAAEKVADKPAGKARRPAPAEPAAAPAADPSIADIAAAINGLDKDNPEHYTKGGKPVVAALEAMLGYEITAAQRDQAMELV